MLVQTQMQMPKARCRQNVVLQKRIRTVPRRPAGSRRVKMVTMVPCGDPFYGHKGGQNFSGTNAVEIKVRVHTLAPWRARRIERGHAHRGSASPRCIRRVGRTTVERRREKASRACGAVGRPFGTFWGRRICPRARAVVEFMLPQHRCETRVADEFGDRVLRVVNMSGGHARDGGGGLTLDMSLYTDIWAISNNSMTSCRFRNIESSFPSGRTMQWARLLRRVWSMLSSQGALGARKALYRARHRLSRRAGRHKGAHSYRTRPPGFPGRHLAFRGRPTARAGGTSW